MTTLADFEAEVQAFITKAETTIVTDVEEAVAFLQNVSALIPGAVAKVTTAANFVESIPGVGTNPDVQAAVSALNVVDAGLQAFAGTMNTASASGGSVTLSTAISAGTAGYQAVKNAEAAAATLTSVATAATTVAQAATPSVTS